MMNEVTPSPPRPDAQAVEVGASQRRSFRVPLRWLWQGLGGVVLWFAPFSLGVLIDSSPSRERLGWKSAKASEKVSEMEQRLLKLENASKEEKQEMATPLPTLAVVAVANVDQAPQLRAERMPHAVADFFLAMFAFMPLNIGFLCIIAAFIGGCAVNKDEIERVEDRIAELAVNDHSVEGERLRRRLSYLTENPVNATMRGLVVYLILISGLFVLGSSPVSMGDNQIIDLTQYMRLAGLFSFFGFIAGNDPTVFFSLLNLGTSRISPRQDEPSGNV